MFLHVEEGVVEQHVVECPEHCSEHCHHRWSHCRDAAVCLVRTQGLRTDGRRLRSLLDIRHTALQPTQLLRRLLQVFLVMCLPVSALVLLFIVGKDIWHVNNNNNNNNNDVSADDKEGQFLFQ